MKHLPGALALLFLASCKSPEQASSTTSVSSAPLPALTTPPAPSASPPESRAAQAFVPSYPVPPFKGRFPHRHDPRADVADRIVEVRFARNGGDVDVAPVFTLTNLTDQKVSVGQTWIYYYDATGKRSDRYPHHVGGFDLEPHQTREKRLGRAIEKIDEEMSIIEGEVTSGTVAGEEWKNENLFATGSRPAGGFTAADLASKAGERVIVDVYDLFSNRVRLTNVTDRAVARADVTFHVAVAKGEAKRLWMAAYEPKEALAPGRSVDVVLKPMFKERVPRDAVRIVAFARRVRFADGTTFENQNLDERRDWAGMKD